MLTRNCNHALPLRAFRSDLPCCLCRLFGLSERGRCGYFKGNWEAGTGFHFTFQKPVVLDAIRLHQQHCCGRDLFGMCASTPRASTLWWVLLV